MEMTTLTSGIIALTWSVFLFLALTAMALMLFLPKQKPTKEREDGEPSTDRYTLEDFTDREITKEYCKRMMKNHKGIIYR